jgi:radical SAM-linked protein
MTRLRVRYAKLGRICWTSHRDTARMWERAFRRVDLPVAYSLGFSPRPKVSFGLALPTGYESVAEYLDIELGGDPPDLALLTDRLTAALPAGVDALVTAVVDDRAPSLQEEVTVCTWRLAVVPIEPGATPDVSGRVRRLLDAESIVVTRQRKQRHVTEDIRPAIVALRLTGMTGEGTWIECDLGTQPRSLRPSELVAALGPDVEERHVRRLHQWIERDGARWEPLAAPPAATEAPHAMVRA